MTEKQRNISIMLNTRLRGKMPADASAKQWHDYHAGFVQSTVTAHEFAAHVYRGYSFCPVYHDQRKQGNFVEAWHVAFDFDENGIDDLKRSPWVDYFISFAYSTPSSTVANPKCRAVFIFEQPIMDAKRYRKLYRALAWWFERDGLKTDPACKDIIRLYYGSARCEVWDNWSILPRAAQNEFIAEYERNNPKHERNVAPTRSYTARSTSEQDIQDALNYIPPEGDYHDWLRVLMAVHSAYPDRRGVAICESWSPGAEGEIVRKFRSFDKGGGGKVNLGTLFHMAKGYGYAPTVRKATGGKASKHQQTLAALDRLR